MCVVLGYLTPGLIDAYSGGEPAAAGQAYAVNVLGCILGPLVASYLLLPWMSAREALLLLGLPLWALYFLAGRPPSGWQRAGIPVMAVAVLAAALFWATDFEHLVSAKTARSEVRRDYAASVISAEVGPEKTKTLLVNGIGMTLLSPITKLMVHLPLVLHEGRPQSVLVICFGMGTSFRSALSWDTETTAVELVPSVPQAFGFYHPDADVALSNPKGHIVIDDGRRYLARTQQKFDLIVIDPPPPPEAAGSSLLYSEEFDQLAKAHLNPHGILQSWVVDPEMVVFQACCARSTTPFPTCGASAPSRVGARIC